MVALSSLVGGGGAAQYPTDVIGVTCNYAWKRDGNVRVHVIGAGGSGPRLSTSNAGVALGGGAGGYARKEFEVVAGETTCLVVGAGGAASSSNSSAGGCSCLTYGANTLVANGGGGGLCCSSLSAGSGYAGGCGGTASGGDYNATGGRGGCIACVPGGSNVFYGTGGGAIGFFTSPGYTGGDVTTCFSELKAASGGGGFVSNGTAVPRSSNCPVEFYGYQSQAGGGASGFGMNQELFKGIAASAFAPQKCFFGQLTISACTDPVLKTFSENDNNVFSCYSRADGAGGHGLIETQTSNCRTYIAGNGGFGAGGGGSAVGTPSCNPSYAFTKAGNGGCGGGGGGHAWSQSAFCSVLSGAGGNGVIVIEYL